MTKEEMKLVKFETMIKDLYSTVFRSGKEFVDKDRKKIQPVSILLGRESDNPFIKIINNKTISNCICGSKPGFDIMPLISDARECAKCRWACCNSAGQLLFISLLCMAIDNDLYNEKLEIVSDAAYLMGFNEQMIEDWITAVKKFLLAEKIGYKEMKTEQAQKFFKEFEERWEKA